MKNSSNAPDSSIPNHTSSLSEWLSYMQQIHVSAIDMGLSRVVPVAQQLGLIQSAKDNAYVFTVAGTNGKGSTTAMIAQTCQQAGYKTALYQSPHLIDFNERVRINGAPVGDQKLVDAFVAVEQARLDCRLTLSFFEMTTLAALLIFAEAQCEVWVLEVGLGGRLDVVNIIDPDLAVITNIGIDHVDWLGDTKEQIGFEKAGILRQNGTLIFGSDEMPHSVQQQIEALQVTCYQAGRDFLYVEDEVGDNQGLIEAKASPTQWQFSSAAVTLQLPTPSLSIMNCANAVAALLASPLNITQADISMALSELKLAGRLDQRQINHRTWLFDVAHNVEGINFILPQLLIRWQRHLVNYPHAQLHLVFSMLGDKPIKEVVTGLARANLPICHWHVAAIDHPRAAPLEVLVEAIDYQEVLNTSDDSSRADGENDDEAIRYNRGNSPSLTTYESLAEASIGVIAATRPTDFIVVCGSFHTISEVLLALKVEAIPT
ncbi:MAG: folylpolyglutamate synthase/dihydrofolate synthase family protein [Psychrobacter sp.]|nr:folylpolyglutamate synthase/dihydrofolate synthase family protein [Psychrobacter sp.]